VRDNKWVPILAVILYLSFLIEGKRFMDRRIKAGKGPVRLGYLPAAWNALLAVFSIWGALRVVPHFMLMFTHYDFRGTICAGPEEVSECSERGVGVKRSTFGGHSGGFAMPPPSLTWHASNEMQRRSDMAYAFTAAAPAQAGYGSGAAGLWVWAFTVSKVAELFDTVILVLKGKEPIFLHWCVRACLCHGMAWRGVSMTLVSRETPP
jgi:hypothetical protein